MRDNEPMTLAVEIQEQTKQFSESLGLEVANARIERLGGRVIQVTYQLLDFEGINE
jgi:hypothetical protein